MKIEIKNNNIVISIPTESLSFAYAAAVDLGYINKGSFILDSDVFSKELLSALLEEDEDGTTIVHKMLDKAMYHATDQGAEGVGEVDDECEQCYGIGLFENSVCSCVKSYQGI